MSEIDPKELCPGTTFDVRDDAHIEGRELYQCTTCGRVNRTTRRHRKPGRTTASHDKTMGILWDAAQPRKEVSGGS